MTTLAIRAAGAACVILSGAFAQQTFVVDSSGGGQFTEVPPAIAAAAPGDTILVRAGNYGSFLVDKGVRLLADPGVLVDDVFGGTVSVSNVPLGQSAVVRGFGSSWGGLRVLVADSAGHVHLESMVAGGLALLTVSIQRAQNVTLTDVAVRSPGLVIDQSTVAMTRCHVVGPLDRAALNVRRSRVWFSEGTCRGATATSPFFRTPTPAISIELSDLIVAGDATTLLAAGTATATVPVSPIVGIGSNIVVDVNVTLQSHAGAPSYTGSGTFRTGQIPSMLAELTTPNQLDLRLHAPGALRGYMLLSLVPAAPVPLGPLGDLWVEPNNLVLDTGIMPPNGVRTATFVVPPIAPGLPVIVQGFAIYPAGPQLSAPAPLTLGR